LFVGCFAPVAVNAVPKIEARKPTVKFEMNCPAVLR
jgi:hypothetical protein